MVKEGLTADEAPASKGMLDDVDSLCVWLQREARISDKFIDSTMQKLVEVEQVETVRDLHVLHGLGGLKDVFPRVTEAKITEALQKLDLGGGPPAAPAPREVQPSHSRDAPAAPVPQEVQPMQPMQPMQQPQTPRQQSKQAVRCTPEKQPTLAPPARRDNTPAAPMECDVPDGKPDDGTGAGDLVAADVGAPRRRGKRGGKDKNKSNGSQQAGRGREALAASQALAPPAAGSVSTTDGHSTQTAGPASPAVPAGNLGHLDARAPSSASTPRASAPVPAAATRRLYKVPSTRPDSRVAEIHRHRWEVWEALEPYDEWVHGATLRDEDTPSDTLGPHSSDPPPEGEEALTPEQAAELEAKDNAELQRLLAEEMKTIRRAILGHQPSIAEEELERLMAHHAKLSPYHPQIYRPGDDHRAPARHNPASRVSWLLTRFNPAGRSFDMPLAQCVDARLPATEQLEKFRYLGWPTGPPTAVELEKMLVARVRKSAKFDAAEERAAQAAEAYARTLARGRRQPAPNPDVLMDDGNDMADEFGSYSDADPAEVQA
jgi:hypothetical protein